MKILNEYALDALIGFALATFFVLIMSFSANAQNVGINNPAPHIKSLLDLTSNDKGLLAPRMTQAQRLAMFPAADATAKGMLVYQTDNTQGFYYYDGASWQCVASGDAGWGLTGNTGTTAASNFIGTSDNNDVVFKSNNVESMRIKTSQKIGIGTANPGSGYASARVEIADETGANSDFAMRTAGGGHPEIVLESSAGTLAAPAVSAPGAWAGAIIGQVYDGTAYTNGSAMVFGTEGVNTPGNVAGNIQFTTNKWGPLGWEKMRLTSGGNLGVGVAAPLNRLDVAGNANVMSDSNYRIGNIRVLSIKGNYNLFVGANTGLNNTGGYNSFVGSGAGNANTSGGSNAFFGHFAGLSNTTGSFNTYLGNNAGLSNVNGAANVCIGSHSNFAGVSGAYNTFIGAHSGYKNLDSNNVFVGQSAGYNNTNGKGNLFLGDASGVMNSTGNRNCFSGQFSGYNNSTGSFNTFYGYNSGTLTTTGSNNTYIGNNARGTAALNNSAAFGYNAYVTTSNSIVLGDTGVNIGVNLPAPLYPLHFRSILGDKIALWGNAGAHYGIGIQNYLLQIHTATAADDIAFGYGNSASFTEKMRIKGNGKVGIGTSTPGSLFPGAILEIADSTGANKDVVIRSSNNTNYQQVLAFARTRGSYSSPAAVQLGDNLGRLTGMGYDGSSLLTAAEIQFHVDSTSGNNNMPGNITFHTTPGNSGTVCKERMRIDRNGFVGIGCMPNPGFILAVETSNHSIFGSTSGTGKTGVTGWATATSGSSRGVSGMSLSDNGIGVYGWANSATGVTVGIYGGSLSTSGYGIQGIGSATTGVNYGVYGAAYSTSGFNGFFTGPGKFASMSNSGFNTNNPQTTVDVNGGLTIRDSVVTANAAVFTITIGNRSYIRVNSNAAPASRLITLSNGLQIGQILMLECTAPGGGNGIRLSDTPATFNTNLATFHDMYENDVITLIWNGTDWLETSYSNN